MMRARLDDEAAVAAGYGTGPWALMRGAMHEFSRRGMWNRVVLVFCSFVLQNMSGAAGKSTKATAASRYGWCPNATFYQQSTTTRPRSLVPSASRTWLCTRVYMASSKVRSSSPFRFASGHQAL
jgi:hypothetical protein